MITLKTLVIFMYICICNIETLNPYDIVVLIDVNRDVRACLIWRLYVPLFRYCMYI